MDARARRRRLPRVVKIAALPVLVAVAGALAFGFTQSNAAPAPNAAAEQTGTAFRSPTLPDGVNAKFLPRHQDLAVRLTLTFVCFKSEAACEQGPTGRAYFTTVDGERHGRQFYWQLNGKAHREKPGNPTFITDASFNVPAEWFTAPGPFEMIQTYGGDANFRGAEEKHDSYIVNGYYTPSWQLSSTPNPSRGGQDVTFTATYNGTGAPDGLRPTAKGRTHFFFEANDRQISEDLVLDKNGNATFTAKNMFSGTYKISVRYSGDGVFDKARIFGQPHTVTSPVVSTKTELTATPTSVTVGQPVAVKVKVTAQSGTATPTGKVTFKYGDHTVSAGSLRNDGTVTANIPLAPAGDYTATAIYEPTGGFAASKSAGVKLKVAKADTTTTVTADPPSAELSKAINFSAKVAAPAGNPLRPTGKVTYRANGTEVGVCELIDSTCDNGWGVRQPGKYTVTYEYSGDGNFNASTGTVNVRWFLGSTTKLTATPSPATAGSALTLTAQVAGADPMISVPLGGKVTFLDGTTEVGKADADKDGKATFSATGLKAGTHVLTARFEGSDALDPSTSEKLSVQINEASDPGQGGGSTGGSQNGGGGGGSTPQPKNLASTGASVGVPVGIGAVLLILGAVALTLGRRRRVRRSR